MKGVKDVDGQIQIYGGDGLPVDIQDGHTFVDPTTGEQVTLRTIKKPFFNGKHFWKVYLADLLAVMGFLDSKQVDVMCYILAHTSPYDNKFSGLQTEIADACECSRPTVQRTIRKMIDANLMAKTSITSVYKVNPSIIVQGKDTKQLALMIEYVQDSSKDVVAEAVELGALPAQEERQINED